ncbi:hypothetical protein E2L08_06495 [Palleronia sediminis]|uniref:YMGG-like Gly-zipper domain-containing protein n=1 Tax=Palleronia sediminis TaxID=2547833 RepID=A0A4R6ADW2_9RHOB|nr:hypothetical protein [Palleronia sediminis]TDL81315.1 hypothetical protein E2L08_06495 [Palleronia sediminis]
MTRLALAAPALLVAAVLSGCVSDDELASGGIGAAGGAVIGEIAADAPLAGAAVGGTAGVLAE